MAKKLARGYKFYPGAPSVGYIEINGRLRAEEILLITNVTDNTIIYNFAQPGLGGVCLFGGEDNYSILNLEADTSSMSADDNLQIFVDSEYSEIDFNEALLDPVNKIRVSSPQNLIDTDFEYGLQPSKWETLELVNNVPSFYPTQSSYVLSDVISVESLRGSDLITVTTASPHGIPVGTPLDVRGLTSLTAEGKYLVASTPTDTTFTYRARANQGATKTISGSYTSITPGEFYTSSDIRYKTDTGLTTDEQSPSKISIQTDYAHGFEAGTSIYLTNTIASKVATVSETLSSTAPDGRPYVDSENILQETLAGDSTLNETKEKTGILYFKFNASSVDIDNDRILWANSGLAVGDALLYVPPAGDTEIGGLQRFQIYYVKSVDAAYITLCETGSGDYTTNPQINFTSTGTYNYGRGEFALAYEIKRMFRGFTQTQTVCPPPPHWICDINPNHSKCAGWDPNCVPSDTVASTTETFLVTRAKYDNTSSTGSGRDLLASSSSNSVNTGRTGYWGMSGFDPERWVLAAKTATLPDAKVWSGLVYSPGYNANFGFAKAGVDPDGYDFIEDFSRFELAQTATGASTTNRLNAGTAGQYSLNNIGSGSYTGASSVPAGYDQTYSSGLYFLVPLLDDQERDTFYVPSHGLITNDTVSVVTGSGTAPVLQAAATSITSAPSFSTLANPQSVQVVRVTADRIRIAVSGSEQRVRTLSGAYSLSSIKENPTKDSVYFADHGFVTGQSTAIRAGAGGVLPTLATSIPRPSNDGDLAVALFNSVKTSLSQVVTSMGSEAVDLYMNGTTATLPFTPGQLTYDAGTYNFSYGLNSVRVDMLNGLFNDAITLPSSGNWSQELAYDFMSNTSFASKGFNIVQSKYEYQAATPFWITLVEVPQENNYGGQNIQIYPVFSSSVSGMAASQAATNNNNSTANWTSLTGGWRYTFDGVYYAPSASASGAHGFFRVSMILDNSNYDGYVSTYSQNITNSSALHATSAGYGGQRYLIDLLLPIKAGATGSNYGLTSGTIASVNSIASTVATNIVSDIVAAQYAGAVTNVIVKVLSKDRLAFKQLDYVNLDFVNSGTAPLELTLSTEAGALDGYYEVSESATNSFSLGTSFTVPARNIEFTAANVSNPVDRIYFNVSDHSLDFGQAIVLADPAGVFTGLSDGTTYYAIPAGVDYFSIAASQEDAGLDIPINISAPGSGSFVFSVAGVNGLIPRDGQVAVSADSKRITGTGGTFFKQFFKDGDTIFVENNTVTPRKIEQLKITSVVSDSEMNLESLPTFATNSTSFLTRTGIYVRPDGAFLHRPFDGGVEITAGTSPNSSIIRQTRKYFRYQSGKGIQCSIAINFNPARPAQSVESSGTIATITTRNPHGLKTNDLVTIAGSLDSAYNGSFLVTDASDFTFQFDLEQTPQTSSPGGLVEYVPSGWTNAAVRCGMYDEQNGFFYEYDGEHLYAVRRSSVQQLSGTAAVENGSNVVYGSNTNFLGQLRANDNVVIRGQTYKVTAIENPTTLHIQPTYRGTSQNEIVMTKTIDTKVPQSEWSLDTADGRGPSGFNLDITKIQMVYMDYSWYGAGKIRFGFKDGDGKVRYFHEFIHNNALNEAYMRSGNLPARYEIENIGTPSYVPSLFHWGTSIIMDGQFDDDKAYLFTASSNSLSYTSGTGVQATTVANSSLVAYKVDGFRTTYDWYVRIPFGVADAGKFSSGIQLYSAVLDGQQVSFTDYANGNFNTYLYVTRSRSTPSAAIYPSVPSGQVVNIGAPAGGSSVDLDLLKAVVPIVTIRLAPSVDNNLSGAIGQRDIINRMQLQLKQLGITTSHDCNIQLILNGSLSSTSYTSVQSPSLSELITHVKGDTIVGGVPIFSLRASGGTLDSTGKRLSNTVEFDLGQITDLGNSILGGDGVFPNGPDILTIAAEIIDTAEVTSTAPFKIAGRMTWTESQA